MCHCTVCAQICKVKGVHICKVKGVHACIYLGPGENLDYLGVWDAIAHDNVKDVPVYVVLVFIWEGCESPNVFVDTHNGHVHFCVRFNMSSCLCDMNVYVKGIHAWQDDSSR